MRDDAGPIVRDAGFQRSPAVVSVVIVGKTGEPLSKPATPRMAQRDAPRESPTATPIGLQWSKADPHLSRQCANRPVRRAARLEDGRSRLQADVPHDLDCLLW
jgi:hypothetical protein